ncbi:hypothetical protein GCM10010231_66440 [Streptomyces sindenensis]|nr:hypothetical protein GCM10010231_66440 [Streptomyces sindenensis]
MLTVVNADGSLIDEIVREGARRMLAAALEAEVNSYIAELADQRDGDGRRMVVRNGYNQPRSVTTAAGTVEVRAPRVNDKRIDEATGERKRFSSAILPPWCRKSPKISEVLPLLYLHGLSSGDFVPALEQFSAPRPASVSSTTPSPWTCASPRTTSIACGPPPSAPPTSPTRAATRRTSTAICAQPTATAPNRKLHEHRHRSRTPHRGGPGLPPPQDRSRP